MLESYLRYIKAKTRKKETEEKLSPLLESLVINSKMAVCDFFIGGEDWQEKEERLIKTKEDVYLVSNEDADKFYRDSHVLYLEQGYEVELHFCPIATARADEIEAEQIFLDEICPLMKVNFQREELNYNPQKRKSFLKEAVLFAETFSDA